MKYFVFPYKTGSESAKALADELNGKRVLREGSTYSHKPNHLLINWGASDCPYRQALNKDITPVIEKLAFFRALAGLGLTPKFATTKDAAVAGLSFPIFCRTRTAGHDGAGVVIADTPSQLVTAPLYVEGINKTSEYRIHLGRFHDGQVVVLGVQKKNKTGTQPQGLDPRVWTGDSVTLVWTVNGTTVVAPPRALEVAKAVFNKFPKLAFGALDVIYDQPNQKAYVIEINTAPMATPKTTKMYADFFRAYAQKVGLPSETSVAATAPTTGPTALTVETVKNKLAIGTLALDDVIKVYIQHQ